jgi:hypothetical protein
MPQNPHARPSPAFSRRALTKPGRANLIEILQVVFAEARGVPGGAWEYLKPGLGLSTHRPGQLAPPFLGVMCASVCQSLRNQLVRFVTA